MAGQGKGLRVKSRKKSPAKMKNRSDPLGSERREGSERTQSG